MNKVERQEGGMRLKGALKESNSLHPLVSIITIVFNGKEFLEDTILSVISQNYPNLEYIIVDGGSTDGTIEILRKYDDQIDYWVSERDRGISDAFNKGVSLARGDYINFQGDGDGFIDPSAVEKMMNGANVEDDYLISGRVQRVDLQGMKLYDSPKFKFRKTSLLFRMSLPHQGLFTNKRFFTKYGLFSLECKFAMDYEHLLRAYRDFPKTKLIPDVIARWRADGVGNGRITEVLKEYDLIKRNNSVAPSWVLSVVYFWSLIKFKVKTLLE
jgi:glycosyltransferase involved in cell wall biosynthesis